MSDYPIGRTDPPVGQALWALSITLAEIARTAEDKSRDPPLSFREAGATATSRRKAGHD